MRVWYTYIPSGRAVVGFCGVMVSFTVAAEEEDFVGDGWWGMVV